LAGVSVGSKGIVVLRKYGNPSAVSPGLGQMTAPTGIATTGANPSNPFATGPGGLPPGIPSAGPYTGGVGPVPSPQYKGGIGPMPNTAGPFGPAGGPGALPPAGSDVASNGMDQAADNSGLTTWTYDQLKKGPDIDFRLNEDGAVVEIVATGFKPNPLTKTRRGVNLGDPYGKVMRLYGFPEQTVQQGNILTVSYAKSAHIAFQFYKLKLVRIDVAKPKKATSITL
jgi:hypothetical protein